MAALVSQFGAALLAVQGALLRSVETAGTVQRAGNLVVISLDRETFFMEQGSLEPEGVQRFRRLAEREIEDFLASNEWALTGPLSVNILLRSLPNSCDVRVEHCRTFFTVTVRDDEGTHTLPVRWPRVVAGRMHEAHPRAFVPVMDSTRAFSREHLLLSYQDLELCVQFMGRNPTSLNDQMLARDESAVLHTGDVIRCGPYSLTVNAIVS